MEKYTLCNATKTGTVGASEPPGRWRGMREDEAGKERGGQGRRRHSEILFQAGGCNEIIFHASVGADWPLRERQ